MFKYDLDATVSIAISGETGKVIGRYDSVSSKNQYLVQYKSGNGCAVENWWAEDTLEAVEQ